jgi:predicted dehydrogenase
MKFFIVGCSNHIANQHINNLKSLGHEVFVSDNNTVALEKVTNKFKVKVYDFMAKIIHFDAWMLCNPPCEHTFFARYCLDNKSDLFIEKPISSIEDRVSDTIKDFKDNNLIMYVGYKYRHHPGLKLLKKLIDDSTIGKVLSIRAERGFNLSEARPDEDYTDTYYVWEHLGGGPIVNSDELDYVTWLSNSKVSEVKCFVERLSNMSSTCEDIAEINLKYENGIIANIHLDYFQRPSTRWCKVIGENGSILWDDNINELKVTVNKNTNYIPINKADNLYLDEIKHFISCIERKETPIVDGTTCLETLKVALECKKSFKQIEPDWMITNIFKEER